jgi:hypothetical protein
LQVARPEPGLQGARVPMERLWGVFGGPPEAEGYKVAACGVALPIGADVECHPTSLTHTI